MICVYVWLYVRFAWLCYFMYVCCVRMRVIRPRYVCGGVIYDEFGMLCLYVLYSCMLCVYVNVRIGYVRALCMYVCYVMCVNMSVQIGCTLCMCVVYVSVRFMYVFMLRRYVNYVM